VDSYSTYGLVNPAGGENLPSRSSVENILRGLDELVFPGFREYGHFDHANLRLITAEKVYHIARELIREIEKSMAFASRTGAGNKGSDGNPKNPPFGGGGANDSERKSPSGCYAAAEMIADDFFDELPAIRGALALDLQAAFRGDPAAKSIEEVIISYPGFEAITVHRLAHFFWTRSVPLIPRIMSEIIHGRTGIDIHPGAEIGESFFIDHGTGVVIGETTIIGKNVKLYQGVTLGALSVKKEEGNKKRHPTIEDNVTIYSGATILGGETIIGRGCTIGGNVWITESVLPGAMVYTKNDGQVVTSR
jgi:serine O-acetyltransferase